MRERFKSKSGKIEWKLWAGMLVLLASFVGVQQWVSNMETSYKRTELPPPTPQQESRKNLPKAKMIPGRIVELDTTKGRITFVLFEQDCPITTSRIAKLVQEGCYNGVKFGRVVKDRLIQTDACTREVKPIGIEVLDGLINTKGAVGMARTSDPNSATSQFYILLEPMRHLDYEYTVFGRLIDGMDVAFRIVQGDLIKSARVRNLTENDKRRFQKVLEIEAKRNTE